MAFSDYVCNNILYCSKAIHLLNFSYFPVKFTFHNLVTIYEFPLTSPALKILIQKTELIIPSPRAILRVGHIRNWTGTILAMTATLANITITNTLLMWQHVPFSTPNFWSLGGHHFAFQLTALGKNEESPPPPFLNFMT